MLFAEEKKQRPSKKPLEQADKINISSKIPEFFPLIRHIHCNYNITHNTIPLMRSFAAGDIDSHCCPSNLMSPCVILCMIKSDDLKLRLLWNGT